MYDPKVGRWLSEAPIWPEDHINPYAFVGNNPTNATDPSGLAKTELKYPWKKDSNDVLLEISAVIEDGKLTIKVQEGEKFAAHKPRGSTFYSIMGGGEDDTEDTDSAQVAVRFTDKGGKDVGHATNAKPAEKARGNGPNAAADWTRGKEPNGKESVSWQKEVPEGATHLEVVVMYTDVLYQPPDLATPTNSQGDLPVIIGSFSGDLIGGKWQIKANPGDVIQQRDGQPKLPEYAGILEGAQKILKEKTGYSLKARPETLQDIRGPSAKLNRRQIDGIIQKAVGKKINKETDTGFDIDPKSYSPPKK
jgi:hypothetical protein